VQVDRRRESAASAVIASRIPNADNPGPKGDAVTSQIKWKPQVAIMNAVHDLPVLVARDKGFFTDEGSKFAIVHRRVVSITSGRYSSTFR
jgi:hypothetical protein